MIETKSIATAGHVTFNVLVAYCPDFEFVATMNPQVCMYQTTHFAGASRREGGRGA